MHGNGRDEWLDFVGWMRPSLSGQLNIWMNVCCLSRSGENTPALHSVIVSRMFFAKSTMASSINNPSSIKRSVIHPSIATSHVPLVLFISCHISPHLYSGMWEPGWWSVTSSSRFIKPSPDDLYVFSNTVETEKTKMPILILQCIQICLHFIQDSFSEQSVLTTVSRWWLQDCISIKQQSKVC